MKKLLLSTLIMGLAILFCGNLSAQLTWDDVILEEKGDTVVVKGAKALAGAINTLWVAVKGDTNADGSRVNLNRVYETIPDEVYLTDGTLELDASVPVLKIVGPPIDRTGDVMPPLHIKQVQVDGSFDKTFFQVNGGDIYVENQYLLLALTNNTLDREIQRNLADSGKSEYKGCIIEFTNWTLTFASAQHQQIKYTDCLLLNIGNEPTIEKGLPVDHWNVLDSLWMENCTVLNAGGVVVGRTPDKVSPNFSYFNHNTFVNTTLPPWSFFSQAEMIATNNMIINTSLLPDYPGFYPFHSDEDLLPKGVINVDTVERAWIANKWPDGYPFMDQDSNSIEEMRKILVDNNNTWWDPRFESMDLPPFPDTINETWASQMFNMNSRSQAMFDDDAAYPYFNEGDWYNIEPDFANNKDLVAEWISFIFTNATPGEPGGGDGMPWWRTNMSDNIWTPDWPPLADLSYTDATLLTGATGGYPVGDLNWFPADKATWMETNESEALIALLKTPATSIDEVSIEGFSSSIEVFPNPMGEMATVRFDISSPANLDLSVFNLLGERVRVMNLGHRAAGVHEVSLNRGDLSPGLYVIQLNTGAISKISIK